MRRIKVEITTENPEDKGPATFAVEVDRGAGTSVVDRRTVPFDRLGKGLEFFLNENEQLIVEPYAKEAVAYSGEQYAAYKVADQEKLGEIDSPDLEPTPEAKAVSALERKRWENDTGIKITGKELKPGEPGYYAPPSGGRDTSSADALVDANQVAGRRTSGPLPDHPNRPGLSPEELKKEQVEREKKEKAEFEAKEKMDEERRKKEEALSKPKIR